MPANKAHTKAGLPFAGMARSYESSHPSQNRFSCACKAFRAGGAVHPQRPVYRLVVL